MAQQLGIYNLARPVPSFLGQLGDLQQLQAGEQQQQMNALAIQDRQRQVQQQQQAQQVQQTINEIAKSAVKPDGTVDRAKLRTGLTNAGLFNVVPDIEETLTKVEKAKADLQESLSKANASEDERIAAAAGLTKASAYSPQVFAETLRGMTQSGAVSQARAAKLLEQLQAAQTPDAVKAIVDPIVGTSKAQTDIAADQARTADTNEQLLDRKGTRERLAAKTDLENYSKQLYNAARNDKTGATYRQAFQGIPEKYREMFVPPDQFEPVEAARRALEASQTPDQIVVRRETEARNDDIAARDKATAERNRIMDASLAASRSDAARHRRWIESHSADAGDPAYKRDFEQYKTFLSKAEPSYASQLEAWKAQHPYPVPDEQGNFPAPPAYTPPPDFETWRAAKNGRQASPARATAKAPVKMRAPNGQIAMVPADQVEAAKKKGAKVVP